MRTETSLIQTIGRAARNASGKVIMYADSVTGAMEKAIGETNRRRAIQDAYNKANGITPKTVVKGVRDVIEIGKAAEEASHAKGQKKMSAAARNKLIETLTAEMREASARLEFEQAAFLRDKIKKLKEQG